MKDIAIFGAGGQGRETLTILKAINRQKEQYQILGFFDDGYAKGTLIHNLPILGGIQELNQWHKPICIVFAIGNSMTRYQVYKNIKNKLIEYPTIIHPNAIIQDEEYSSIGMGCLICAGCILNTDIKLGDFTFVNYNTTIGHDAVIGAFCSLMPSVNISGETNIGECTYVGTGAQIINLIDIGANTIIGAGTVVVNHIPDHSLVVGVPGKVIKKIKEE